MIITTGENWSTVCVIYYLYICVTCRNKHPILLAIQFQSWRTVLQAFTCVLHCSHILGWTDRKESDLLQNPAEAECLSAALPCALGRFCCHHVVLFPAVCPAITENCASV